MKEIKTGDTVTRMLGGKIPMKLNVTDIDDEFIYCGEKDIGWKFYKDTLAEFDEYLGSTKEGGMTVSFLIRPE